MAALLLLLVACSGGGGSSGATSEGETAPVTGGPCGPADAKLVIGGVENICMLASSGALAWTPDGPSGTNPDQGAAVGLAASSDIPAVVENRGFDLRPFDPATGMAGAMKITGVTTPAPDPTNQMDSRYLIVDYGDPGSGTADVQMSFFLPLGTPVLAMVTGVVCDVPKLYSDDYSVRIAPTGTECAAPGRASVLFETEHVIDPIVAVGDPVVAGQRVATVSDYRRDWKALGLGVVEIGAFFAKAGDGTPWHAYPARFLAPARATELTAALASAHAAWEAESREPALYDDATESPLGCTTVADVNA